MKTRVQRGCAAALAAVIAVLMPVAASAEEPIPVMVLGSYHFTGGGLDQVNKAVDDHLSPARQEEIARVLDRLERFKPTKIMVEVEPQFEERINQQYRDYVAGRFALRVSETDQLGMALAKRLGHTRLYAVDFKNGMDFPAMVGAAQAAGQTRLLGDFQSMMGEAERMFGQMHGSVLETLRVHNSPQALAMHDGYLTLAQMGTPAEPVGAKQMADWWGRNLIIFARIAQQAEPGDRILVIYGSSHKFLLDHFFDRAAQFESVQVLDYLN